MIRRFFTWAVVASASSLAAQDNVLVLIADDMGAEVVASYGIGADPPPTPQITALADRGVLFRNAWASPFCSPTRAALHTGRHAFRTFVGDRPEEGGGVMKPAEITLPEVLDLAESGYAHALIGKWHLGKTHGGDSAPNVAGWSHYAGFLGGRTQSYFRWPRTVNGVTRQSEVYATTKMVDDALAWIGNQNDPWLCVLSFTAPHFPFEAPPAALHTRNLAGKNPSSDPRAFYDAMVEAMDTEIGRLLGSLGPALADTNVIFLGDNGTPGAVIDPQFGAARSKGTPYEGGVHVPLIIAGPAVAGPARDEDALVGVVDLFATIAELAGVDLGGVIPPWVPVDAVSMVPYLRSGEHRPLRTTLLAEKFAGGNFSRVTANGFAAMRNERYKVVLRYPARDSRTHAELYDLDADPFEAANLLAGQLTGEALREYARLTRALAALRTPGADFVTFGARECQGSAGIPRIGNEGAPALGATYAVTLDGGPAHQPALLLSGESTTAWGPFTLPLDLATLGGGASCTVYNSGEVLLPTTTDAAGRAAVHVDIPVDASLVGETWFHGWLVTDPAAPNNPTGITASDAAVVVVGF